MEKLIYLILSWKETPIIGRASEFYVTEAFDTKESALTCLKNHAQMKSVICRSVDWENDQEFTAYHLDKNIEKFKLSLAVYDPR